MAMTMMTTTMMSMCRTSIISQTNIAKCTCIDLLIPKPKMNRPKGLNISKKIENGTPVCWYLTKYTDFCAIMTITIYIDR